MWSTIGTLVCYAPCSWLLGFSILFRIECLLLSCPFLLPSTDWSSIRLRIYIQRSASTSPFSGSHSVPPLRMQLFSWLLRCWCETQWVVISIESKFPGEKKENESRYSSLVPKRDGDRGRGGDWSQVSFLVLLVLLLLYPPHPPIIHSSWSLTIENHFSPAPPEDGS